MVNGIVPLSIRKKEKRKKKKHYENLRIDWSFALIPFLIYFVILKENVG